MKIPELIEEIVQCAMALRSDFDPKLRASAGDIASSGELTELWSTFDGQESDASPFLPHQMRLVSVVESERIRARLLRQDELYDLGVYFPDYWIPFTEDGGGDYCVIDTRTGEVVFFGCHGEPPEAIAPSISNWLSEWLSAFKAGDVELDDGAFYLVEPKRWFQFWK